jgi:hypothetical protein
MPLSPKQKQAKARKFAAAIPAAEEVLRGPTFETAETYYMPKLAGELVRPNGCPPNGYATHEEALAGAREYRDACKRYLST